MMGVQADGPRLVYICTLSVYIELPCGCRSGPFSIERLPALGRGRHLRAVVRVFGWAADQLSFHAK